ncbi:MAG: hypothetical protein OEV44_01255 [Spirochaetota bacterium]|nr:hypothetical protein [Spirochaetota bacterium]
MKKKLIMLISISIFLVIQTLAFTEEKAKNEELLKITGFVDFISSVRMGNAKTELGKGAMNLYLFSLNFDGSHDIFGYHATVNLTGTGANKNADTKNFKDYKHPMWLEEGYVFVKLPIGSDSKLKIGSIYNPFGLQGDNSWYLSYHYYAGLTLDADYGVVFDSNFAAGKSVNVNFAIGYYMNDDRQNGTRNGGLDIGIENDPNTEERDKVVARLVGTMKFSKLSLGLGASAMLGKIENTGNPAGSDTRQQVFEGDLDFKGDFGKVELRLFGEFITAQRNKDAVVSIGNKNYNLWLGGASFKFNTGSKYFKSIDLHGNYSQVKRHGPAGIKSDLLIVGSAINVYNPFTVTIEYVKGKNDTSKPIDGNRFEDGIYIDFLYNF